MPTTNPTDLESGSLRIHPAASSVLLLLLVGLVTLVLQYGVRRDPIGAHAQLEILAVFIGLSIFFLSAAKYVVLRDRLYLPVAGAFLATLLFEAVHSVSDTRALIDLSGPPTALVPDSDLFGYGWWFARMSLAAGLLLVVYALGHPKEATRPAQDLWRTSLSVVIGAAILLYMATTGVLPAYHAASATWTRALEAMPLLAFAGGLAWLVRSAGGRWEGARITALAAFALAIATQFFAIGASHPYDRWFFAAHLVKLGGYTVVLFGLYAEHANLFSVERRLRETLERANVDVTQSKRELEAVIEHVTEGIAIADRTGRLLRINQAGQEMLGRNPVGEDPATYLKAHQVLKPDGQPLQPNEHPIFIAVMDGRRAAEIEVTIQRPNGERRSLRCGAVPLFNPQGTVSGAVCSFHDVTEIRRAEQQYRQLSENAPDGVVVMDQLGRIAFFNAAAERIFGYAAGEVLGKDVTMIMPERYRGAHVESRRQRFKSGEPLQRTLEVHGLRKDGREVPVEVSLSSVRGVTGASFIANIRDTSVQQRVRRQREGILSVTQALSTTQALDDFLHRACSSILVATEFDACAIFLLDAQRQHLLLRASERLPEDVKTRIRRYPVRPDYPALAVQTFLQNRLLVEPRLQDRTDLAVGAELIHKYGFQVIMSSPIRSGERILGVVQVVANQARHAQEEDRQILEVLSNELGLGIQQKNLILQLESSSQELRRANQELDSFIYTASHDLSEPLRSISNFSHFLLEDYSDRLDEEGRQHLQRVNAGAARMKRLLDDLLRLSRFGRHQARREPLDLAEVVKEIQESLDASLRERKAVIILKEPLPPIQADRTSLTEVLANLISNGIKFNESATPRVEIGAVPRNGSLELYVRDNGIGISPEHHDRIFGLFSRLHTRKEYPGTGAGLAIVKKIVETQGGAVRLESQPGEGTTFYFTLPNPPEPNGAP